MSDVYLPLDRITAITIAGRDRLKWLNNLVTNDLRKTTQGQAVECFVTDVKGRTLSHGIVYSDRETLVYFSWGENQAPKLLAHWDRYIIREDVTLADASPHWRWSLVQRNWLADVLNDEKLGTDEILNLSEMQIATSSDADSLVAIACGMAGADRLLLRILPGEASDRLLPNRCDILEDNDATKLEAIRIRHRWPLVGIDFDDKNLPQELDRNESAISFNKGCYLGQETVARLDALGQVQKKLVLLSIDMSGPESHPAIPRQTIIMKGDQEAGVLTSITEPDSNNRCMAMAYIKRAHFSAGTELDCQGRVAVIQS